MPINRPPRQSGFILVTLIFLLLVGALLLAAMAYLYGTADTQQSLQNSGAQAFIAAESGDQYGVYYLETTYTKTLPPAGSTTLTQSPMPNPSCPAAVTITCTKPKGGGNTCLVQSVATCPSSGAQWTVIRTVTAAAGGGGKGGGGASITYTVNGWIEQ